MHPATVSSWHTPRAKQSSRYSAKRFAAAPDGAHNTEEVTSAAQLLKDLQSLLDDPPLDSIQDSEGKLWKQQLLDTAAEAMGLARKGANEGGGKVLQFQFELVRYIQILTTTLNMIKASRSGETVSARLAQAVEQCSKATQLAELIESAPEVL